MLGLISYFTVAWGWVLPWLHTAGKNMVHYIYSLLSGDWNDIKISQFILMGYSINSKHTWTLICVLHTGVGASVWRGGPKEVRKREIDLFTRFF